LYDGLKLARKKIGVKSDVLEPFTHDIDVTVKSGHSSHEDATIIQINRLETPVLAISRDIC